MTRSRDEILDVLRGRSIGRCPVFSGLPSLTLSGLHAVGIRYDEAHTDAAKMAAAAASTFEISGFESAVVPFDLCVEAEALGCHVDFQTDLDIFMPPVVDIPLNLQEWQSAFSDARPASGRITLIGDAIRTLKQGVGREVAIGAWVPGPFTLAWQMFGADAWLSGTKDYPTARKILDSAADFLVLVANSYVTSGADFLTVHEMGGSPQVIGADKFRTLVKPALVSLFARLPSPNVLSVCGSTNSAVPDLANCGADALSFDQQNDIARTRLSLPDAIILGNIDPVGVLAHGTPEAVQAAVHKAAEAKVNAIWPGCDLQPEIPDENLLALMSAGILNTPS